LFVAVMTSLLGHVVVVAHPVCFMACGSRWRSGSLARRRLRRVSACPSGSLRLASLSGGGRPARTCRLHSAPECSLRSTLPGHLQRAASPAPPGLAPIEENSQSQSHGRSTSGRKSAYDTYTSF